MPRWAASSYVCRLSMKRSTRLLRNGLSVGVSPRRYAELCRIERLKGELRGGESVTAAIYAARAGLARCLQ